MSKTDSSKSQQALHGWENLLSDLEKRQAKARAMGGTEKLKQRAALGEMNARQRIEFLVDPKSFQEIGTLVGALSEEAPADAFPAGMASINGRPVLVGAEDFTVKGGSIGLGAADKRYRLTQLALSEKVPLVFILHGAGHRLSNSLRGHGRTPNDLQGLVDLAGVVPTVCVVLGPSAGHGALAAPLMDFVVMSENGALFSAGPPLVEAATGERIGKQELGGPDVHIKQSGVAHNLSENDSEALQTARRYLSYLPSNAWQYPESIQSADMGERNLDDILALIPPEDRRPYSMSRVLTLLFDDSSVFEIQPHFGRSLITALARLGGASVAVVANDPSHKAGTFDRAAAEKGARFLEVMGSFHLPVIFLADNPGVMAGSVAEREGALRAAARMFSAQRRLHGPKFHVTLRKAFGFGSSLMGMNPFDEQTLSLAFPGATLGAMPAEGGGAAAHSDKKEQAALDAVEANGPFRIADSLGFDEIIDPRQLRNSLLRGLELSSTRRTLPARPHPRYGALP